MAAVIHKTVESSGGSGSYSNIEVCHFTDTPGGRNYTNDYMIFRNYVVSGSTHEPWAYDNGRRISFDTSIECEDIAYITWLKYTSDPSDVVLDGESIRSSYISYDYHDPHTISGTWILFS